MVMQRGDIFWADLSDPIGSDPGYRRPVLVIQDNAFNNSKLATVIIVSITSNINLKSFPGCVLLTKSESGLPKDSVINTSQIRTIDKSVLTEHVSQLDDSIMFMIDNLLRLTLGLQ
jgi:mRNA interferase MazF